MVADEVEPGSSASTASTWSSSASAHSSSKNSSRVRDGGRPLLDLGHQRRRSPRRWCRWRSAGWRSCRPGPGGRAVGERRLNASSSARIEACRPRPVRLDLVGDGVGLVEQLVDRRTPASSGSRSQATSAAPKLAGAEWFGTVSVTRRRLDNRPPTRRPLPHVEAGLERHQVELAVPGIDPHVHVPVKGSDAPTEV